MASFDGARGLRLKTEDEDDLGDPHARATRLTVLQKFYLTYHPTNFTIVPPPPFEETSVHFGTPPVMDAVAWKILAGVAELTAASYLNGEHESHLRNPIRRMICGTLTAITRGRLRDLDHLRRTYRR